MSSLQSRYLRIRCLISPVRRLLSIAHPRARRPPIANRQKVPEDHDNPGRTLTDNYAWLRKKDTPAVMRTSRPRTLTPKRARGTLAALQETLYKEMLGRIKESDERSGPGDGYWYYTRTEEGKRTRFLSQKGLARRARRGLSRSERAGAGQEVPCPWRLRREPRRLDG